MSSDQFKAGDIVELKSGGPPMTVTGVDTNLVGYTEIKCQWFFGKMETGTFSPAVLVPSQPRKFDDLKGSYSASAPGDSAPGKTESSSGSS